MPDHHAPEALSPMILACEERIINCWPAIETMLVGDFLLRFAHGYSGRANSASPLRPEAALDDAGIGHVEALYRQAGLPPIFRATPLMSKVMRRTLDQRGYRLKDASIGMIHEIADPSPPILDGTIRITFPTQPQPEWLNGISRHQSPEKRSPDHLHAIVSRIRVPAFFATLHWDGAPVAFGLLAIDRGMAELASIMLDPTMRGRGLGRILVRAMLDHAARSGATHAFLQVASDNTVAKGLYESLGFHPLYAYETLLLRR